MFLGLAGLKIGSLAECFGALGTIAAVVLALWQSFFGVQKDQRLKDKRAYAKRLMKNMLVIKNSFNKINELFIFKNHPVAQYDAQRNGSVVDTETKTEFELKKIIFNLITEIEIDLELAHIDKFISSPQVYNDVKKELEGMRTNLSCADRSVQDTEGTLFMEETRRDPSTPHEELTAFEQKAFDETTSRLDEGKQAIEQLETRIKKIFY